MWSWIWKSRTERFVHEKSSVTMPTFLYLCLPSFLTYESYFSVLGCLVWVYQQTRIPKGLNICTWCLAGKWDLWASDLFAPSPLLGNVRFQGWWSSTFHDLCINKNKTQYCASEHKCVLNRPTLHFSVSVRHGITVWIALTKENQAGFFVVLFFVFSCFVLLCFSTRALLIKQQFSCLHFEVSFITCPVLSQQKATSKAVSLRPSLFWLPN